MCLALFACFAQAALLARIAKTATGKPCNRFKTLGWLGLDCVKIHLTQMYFSKQPWSWFWS